MGKRRRRVDEGKDWMREEEWLERDISKKRKRRAGKGEGYTLDGGRRTANKGEGW